MSARRLMRLALVLSLLFGATPRGAVAQPVSPPEPVAPPTLGLVPSGSMITRYELRTRYPVTVPLVDDAVLYRARFGLTTTPITVADDLAVVVRFVPQASGPWHVGGDQLVDPTLALHEGLVMITGEHFRIDVGRFEMNYGDAFILGNVDWAVSARAFDAVRLHVTPGTTGMWIDAFVSVLNEGDSVVPVPVPKEFASDDAYLGGVYAGLGPLIARALHLDAYVLAKVVTTAYSSGTSVDPSARLTLGARIKHTTGILDYRLEAGAQVGSAARDVTVLAYQGDLEVGVMLASKLRVAGEVLFASGDDPLTTGIAEGWDQLYPTAHKWLGFTDIIGPRTNIVSGVLHGSYAPTDALKLMVVAHLFGRPQRTSSPRGYAGAELDLGFSYQLGRGLALRSTYNLFVPDPDLYLSGRTAYFFEGEIRYDF